MRWFGLLLAVAGQPVEVDLDGSTHSASGPRLAFDVDGVLRALTLADPARVLTEAAAFLDALPAGASVKCAWPTAACESNGGDAAAVILGAAAAAAWPAVASVGNRRTAGGRWPRNAPGARDATPRRLRVGPAGGGPRVVDVVGGLRANARVRVPPARRVRDGTRGRGRRACRTAEPPPERAPPQALAAPRFAGERRQRLPNYRLGRRRRRCHLDGDAAPGAGTRGGHARRRRAPDLRGARTVQHRRRRSDARRRPRVVPVAPRVARAVRDRAMLVPPPGLRLVGQHGARPRGGRGRGRLRVCRMARCRRSGRR